MSASIAPTKAAKVPESGAADAPDATETAQTCTEKAAPASVAQNGAERDELAAALVRQICISTELRRERDEARAAVSRLNRRVQVAESAIAELTGTGEGKASQVSREIWTRCEESHGLLCATTSRARGTAVALEAENARLREGIERLATEMQRGRLIPGTPVFGCAACGMPNESEACEDHDEGLQHAGDMLRAMLAEGGE
jgi:hypothetical protein